MHIVLIIMNTKQLILSSIALKKELMMAVELL